MRYVSIVIISAMFYCFSGYRAVYLFFIKGAQANAEYSIKNGIGNNLLLTFNSAEYTSINWKEKGKEFLYQEQLFDVAGIQKSGNNYILQVYSDVNETRWIKALNEYVKEIFSPRRSEGMNHAESLFTAFQKEYPPLSGLKIIRCTEQEEISHPVFKGHESFIPVKPVWHPPACC
jgi:hypothetical protein